jgi:3-hydroxybutyryl-CoA dehydratase
MITDNLVSLQGLLTFEEIQIGRKYSAVRAFKAAEVEAYAKLSGDVDPLHMDEEFAARTPFGRRVVPGILTAGMVSMVHTQLTGPGFASVGQELRFPEPLFIGETVTCEVTVIGKKEAKQILILDTMVRKKTGEAVLSGLSALKKLKLR